MISVDKKAHCYGCTACETICPVDSIAMIEDSEGFLYPKVDESKCIKCKKCINVCPYLNKPLRNKVLNVYATQNKNDQTRKESSSGGTFPLLSEDIIDNKGVVFGCGLDENCNAVHMNIDNSDDMKMLRNSKYVQSFLGDSFKMAKSLLSEGRQVLFSGTPCQIAGFKNYLGKEYNNLLTIDLLCHGVPSPKLYREYLEKLEKEYDSKVKYVDFRNKIKSWKRLYTEIIFESGQRYFKFCGYDSYMSLFLNNISLRPSCFECQFCTTERQGDISLGDFWGIGKHIPNFDDDKGTSLVIINTKKGQAAFSNIKSKFRYCDSNIDNAISGNKVLVEPSVKNTNRDKFYKMYKEDGVERAIDAYVNIPTIPVQLFYDIRRKCFDIYRFVVKKNW